MGCRNTPWASRVRKERQRATTIMVTDKLHAWEETEGELVRTSDVRNNYDRSNAVLPDSALSWGVEWQVIYNWKYTPCTAPVWGVEIHPG